MKKIIVAALALSLVVVARAEYLYWMVGDNYAANATEGSDELFAYLKATTSSDTYASTDVQLDSATADDVYGAYTDKVGFEFDLGASSIGSNASSYYFYIELSNGYKTTLTSYSGLNDYILRSGTAIPSSTFNIAGFGSGTTAYNVPEPTSGLLFVIGGMLLGLKRKRQV